uniref:C2H2-type domain-containing protein n=1 Tax=Tetranychus urticae TaxID=32264 RepID=T1L5Q8_TETUR
MVQVNPDSSKVVLKKNKCLNEKRTFYLNLVKDGEILNAEKLNERMKSKMVKVSGTKNNYLKCACPKCLESDIDTFGRSNSLLEHMRHQEDITIQCVYCDEFFTSWQRIQGHLRNYHWKAGEINELLDKENCKDFFSVIK